jgi:hypothetical protein
MEAKMWAAASRDRLSGRAKANTWLVRLLKHVLDNPGADRARVDAVIGVYESF